MDDNLFKFVLTAVTGFISYCIYGIKVNNRKHEKHEISISKLETRTAVADAQMKSIIDKLEDVLSLGADLKASNKTILNALARKARNARD